MDKAPAQGSRSMPLQLSPSYPTVVLQSAR